MSQTNTHTDTQFLGCLEILSDLIIVSFMISFLFKIKNKKNKLNLVFKKSYIVKYTLGFSISFLDALASLVLMVVTDSLTERI